MEKMRKLIPQKILNKLFSSYFSEKPNFMVESIEVRLNEINLERLQKKGEKLSSREHDKDRGINFLIFSIYIFLNICTLFA